MADDALAARIAALLKPLKPTSKKMFGGTCFMLGDHMLAGTLKGELLVRVGKHNHAAAVKRPHARAMEMGGRRMEGYVSVAPAGIKTDKALDDWLKLAIAFVRTLPPKKAKKMKIAG
jgi:TfoX/Sxy family transcriptional regulator of competence genes